MLLASSLIRELLLTSTQLSVFIIIIIIIIFYHSQSTDAYFALVRFKLVYASVAWNSVTVTDLNKLEHIKKICSPLPQ
jgi:hypothetical protein